jgi:hypothetical protein
MYQKTIGGFSVGHNIANTFLLLWADLFKDHETLKSGVDTL